MKTYATILTCLLFLAITAIPPREGGAIEIDPVAKWSTKLTPGSNGYYLNNNVFDGGVLVGQISYGARLFDAAGNQLHSAQITDTSKSAIRLGDYYYIGGSNAQGIGRIDATGANAWNAATWTGFVNPGSTGPESMATNGTLVFTNDDSVQNRIHAYSVGSDSSPFTLNEVWATDLPTGGRVRGITYDPSTNYLYVHNGGTNGTTNNDFYAIDATTGTATFMGEHTEGVVYQALRYGDELLVFGNSDTMSAYSLLDDTTIGTMLQQTNLGMGDIYGAAIFDDTLVISSASAKLSGFAVVPEPSTWAAAASLSACGLGLGLWRRRRRVRTSKGDSGSSAPGNASPSILSQNVLCLDKGSSAGRGLDSRTPSSLGARRAVRTRIVSDSNRRRPTC